jgi:hypothetical protein
MASVSGVHRRQCLKSPQKFCYICGSYVFDTKVLQIDSFVKKLYFSYFQLKVACNTCLEGLRYWYDGKRKEMPFAIPMQRREQKNHYDDCYFCMVNFTGYNKKNKKGITYPNLLSAIRPDPQLHVTTLPESTQEFKNTQILRETKKGDLGILTYISKECNVSKLSTRVPVTMLAKLLYTGHYTSLHLSHCDVTTDNQDVYTTLFVYRNDSVTS